MDPLNKIFKLYLKVFDIIFLRITVNCPIPFLVIISLCFINSQTVFGEDCEEANAQDKGYENVSKCVDNKHHQSDYEILVQDVMGNFQLAWPTFKIFANAAKSAIIKNSEECWQSRYIEYAGIISYASMMTRLYNMIQNYRNVDRILNEMEGLTIGHLDDMEKLELISEIGKSSKNDKNASKNSTKEIEITDFYELMLSEFLEARRFADVDVVGDYIDVANSALETPLAISEIYDELTNSCKPNPPFFRSSP